MSDYPDQVQHHPSEDTPQTMERSARFIQLLTTHRNNIYAFILTLVHNFSDADDLMQETTSLMWRKYIENDDVQNFVAWGIRIAHNKVLDFRKRKARERIMFNQEICEELAGSYTNTGDEMDSMLRALDDCVAKLNRRNRQLVEMVHRKGATIKHVAQQVGLSVHTAYKLIPRIHHQGTSNKAVLEDKFFSNDF